MLTMVQVFFPFFLFLYKGQDKKACIEATRRYRMSSRGEQWKAVSDTCSLIHQILIGPSVTMKRFHNTATAETHSGPHPSCSAR